ncbi:MAG TPA: hypothetical protein VLI04_06425 [Nocardioidaceae bacterium]|nr:hypothetical protein [Nocardioidaceae bacterium]
MTAASAADPFVDRESKYWSWEMPRSWDVHYKTDRLFWASGDGEEDGLSANVSRETYDTRCASGDTWQIRVKRFFRQHRQSLRSRGWRILDTSKIFHPQGADPRVRRQRMRITGGNGRALEVVDYGFVGPGEGALLCHRELWYHENDPRRHSAVALQRIKRVLDSIQYKR